MAKPTRASVPVPNMEALAHLYRKAVSGKDVGAARIAESAAITFARGEAAIAESVAMVSFLEHVG